MQYFAKYPIRQVSAEMIWPLRHAVLNKGTARTSPEFEGDHDRDALHLTAFDNDAAIGCVSLRRCEYPGDWPPAADWFERDDVDFNAGDLPDEKPQWQMRGMAVDERYRGLSLGRALVDALMTRMIEHDQRYRDALSERIAAGNIMVWCSARSHVLDFYRKMAWVQTSEVYEKPQIGPHANMIRMLDESCR